MQTFLPLPNFKASAKVLDYRRLGKQRVEAMQILNVLHGKQKSNGWKSHPAVLMWVSYETALEKYHDAMITEWVARGYNNSMKLFNPVGRVKMPWWFGDERLHASHRSNLIRKDADFYRGFGWAEGPDLEYWWPTSQTH